MHKMTKLAGMWNLSLRRCASVAGISILLLGLPTLAQVEGAAQQTGSISGSVLKATSNEPVRGALITVEAQDPNAVNYRAFTDNDGRFTVKAVRAGKYIVTARKSGFAFQVYSDGAGPTIIALREGQRLDDIKMRMFEPAVISGHVTDEDGDPVRDAEVSALATRQLGSNVRLAPVAHTKTDDRGDFRLSGLQPGQYMVKVAPVDPLSRAASSRNIGTYVDEVPAARYVATYYPNVVDVQEAIPLEVKWGQEVPITISVTRSETYSVSGRVAGKLDSSIALILRSARAVGNSVGNEAELRRDGHFVFRHVAPGDYVLLASSRESGVYYSARQSVRVSAANVTNLMVALDPPFTLSGRVVVDGPAPRQFLLAVQAIPTDDETAGAFIARVKDDGTFTIRSISAGTYAIRTTGLPDNFYLKSATLGREDAMNEIALNRNNATAPLQLVLSPSGGRIEGVVTDDDHRAVSGAQVAVVPEERSASWDTMRGYLIADQNGRFKMRGLPPGSYRLIAWRSGTLQKPLEAELANSLSSAKQLKVEPNGAYQVGLTVSEELATGR